MGISDLGKSDGMLRGGGGRQADEVWPTLHPSSATFTLSLSTMAKKLKELSNVDIDQMASSLRGYGGCMSKDELPRSLGRKFYVVNMQDSNKGGGTHWVLTDNRGKQVIYFDSMGEVPPTSIKSRMKATGKKQVINNIELQPMGSVTCGWWCLAAAKALQHMSLSDFVREFSPQDFKANDKQLASMFS